MSNSKQFTQGQYCEETLVDLDLNLLQTLASTVIDQSNKSIVCLLSTQSPEKQFIVLRSKDITKPLSEILNQKELQVQGTIRDTDAVIVTESKSDIDNIRKKLTTFLS